MNPFEEYLAQMFGRLQQQQSPPPLDNPYAKFLDKAFAPRDVTVNTPGMGPAAGSSAMLRTPLDFFPVVGEALAAHDFNEARKQDSKLGMALAAVGMLPVIPNIAGKVLKKTGSAALKDNVSSALKEKNIENVRSSLRFPETIAIQAKSPILTAHPERVFKTGSMVSEDFNLLEYIRSQVDSDRFSPIDPTLASGESFKLKADLPSNEVVRNILRNGWYLDKTADWPILPQVRKALEEATSIESPHTYSAIVNPGPYGPIQTEVPLLKQPRGDEMVKSLNYLSKLNNQSTLLGRGLGSQINKNNNLFEALTSGFNGIDPNEIRHSLGRYSSMAEFPQYSPKHAGQGHENMMILNNLDWTGPSWFEVFGAAPLFALPAALKAKNKEDKKKKKK